MGAKLLYRGDNKREIAVDLPPNGGYLGRAPECLVRTADPLVRRHHARILPEGALWSIEDLGTIAGKTSVNGRVLSTGRTMLHPGDFICCRSLYVRFVSSNQRLADSTLLEHGLARGQRIGKYRVERTLGVGAMGAVYEAFHDDIGRRVALKILHAEHARKPDLIIRFQNEARAVNLIKHPGIVDIYDAGQLPDGTLFIVMEYLEGEPLSQRLRGIPCPDLVAVLSLARQVASALAAAHDKGIVHRDLKPDNIFVLPHPYLASNELAKVLDFGIAKVVAPLRPAQGSPRTGTNLLMGTPRYMSPEQANGARWAGRPSDVYALGIVLYEMLAGEPPFSHQMTPALLVQHLTEEPPPLSRRNPALPAVLVGLVHRMLYKDPAVRPTMSDVVVQVEQILSTLRLSTV